VKNDDRLRRFVQEAKAVAFYTSPVGQKLFEGKLLEE
jgi:hypothetical protein